MDHASDFDSASDRMVTAMRETAARLNGIVQSAMDALITVDENQDILLFNPAAEKMFGCVMADVLGTPIDQFIPSRHRQAHRHHIAQFGTTGVSSRRMGTSEIVALRANGREFPVEASISQSVVSGRKLFTVILRDITERKRTEAALKASAERYQRLMALVPDAIWVERENRIQFANRACVTLLAASSENEILGKSPLDFIHADFHALAQARRERLMLGFNDQPLVEKKIIRMDGETRDVEIAETCFRDDDTTVILAVLRDVTERKRADSALLESRENLERLSNALQEVREEEKARIARELHDELGQALTGLKMDLEQIASTLVSGQTEAQGRVAAMRSLLDGTVASVRRIATELRPLMLDDLGLITTMEWLAGEFKTRNKIAVDFRLPPDHPAFPPELSTALFRVFQEALTNIARHAKAQHVIVELNCSDAEIRLMVRDDGIGVSASKPVRPNAFGLLGMRERARMLGGHLLIESKPGEGTSVIMSVPLSLPTKPT